VLRYAAERIVRANIDIEFGLVFVDLDFVSPLYFPMDLLLYLWESGPY
jgi:hypothetical protein